MESPAASRSFVVVLDKEKEEKRASNLFLIMGFGYLFPYWALAQPVDYWKHLFPSFNIEFGISCVYNIANVVTLLLILWKGGKQWYSGRIVGGFLVQVVILVIIPISYFILHGENQHMWLVLASSAVVAVAGSFLDSSVFSLASLYPKGGIENVQLGIGLSLLITAVYRDLTKAFFVADLVVESTMVYFGVGAITVAGGIIAYYLLLRLPLTRECMKDDTAQDVVQWSILRKILPNELLVSASCMCTLLLWPGVLSAIPSYNFPNLNASGWWPLVIMTIYAAFDVCGRYCVRYRCGFTHENIWKIVAPRFLLVPLLLCSSKGWIFTHDLFSMLFVVALAFSHGYVGTLSVVVVNDCIEKSQASATGMFSAFFLNFGLVVGASLSLLLAHLLDL